jgi:DNA polymerase-3 subunit epsilon
VKFEGGTVKEVWQALVNPEDYFDGFNVSIHGITEESVKDSPTFAGIYDEVVARLHGRIIASHTSFDRVAVSRVCEKYDRPPIEGTWLDTARVARRAWPQFARAGFGLKNVAQTLGIEFEHHKAQEDARAAGEVLVRAIRETGSLRTPGWIGSSSRFNREGLHRHLLPA